MPNILRHATAEALNEYVRDCAKYERRRQSPHAPKQEEPDSGSPGRGIRRQEKKHE